MEVVDLGGGAEKYTVDDTMPGIQKGAPPTLAKKDQPTPAEAKRLAKPPKRTFDPNSLKGDDIAKHQSLILQLCAYGQSRVFGSHLKTANFDLTPNSLRKTSIEDLESLLIRVRTACKGYVQGDGFEQLFFGCVEGLERVCVNSRINSKIKLRGSCDLMRRDDKLIASLELMRLENQSVCQTPAWVQILLCVMAAVCQSHACNTYLEHKKRTAAATDDDAPPAKRARTEQKSPTIK